MSPKLRSFITAELSPWRLLLLILAVVFLGEFTVMMILPSLPVDERSEMILGLIDACMLTLILVPPVWWFIVRPLQRTAAVRADLVKEFIEQQETERRRIARDLHDEIGQSFTSVLIGLRTLDMSRVPPEVSRRLVELAGVVDNTLHEVRRLARGLRPAILDHLGLAQAIQQCLDDFSAAYKISVECDSNGLEGMARLPLAVETAVYRIIQESLTNIARHAHCGHVKVIMRLKDGEFGVQVIDDGCGFPQPTAIRQANAPWSGGIRGMIERAALLHGTLHVDSRPGEGTRVSLRVPLPKPGDA